MKRILPTGDLAFKKVLASEDTKDILSGLINDFFGLEIPADEIMLENPYSIEAYREFIKGEEVSKLRQTIKDVAASFKLADFISEIQVAKTRFFDERALYYPFERFCNNYNRSSFMELTPKGKPNRYSSLRPVYALNILGYNHFDDDGDNEALRIFELYDRKRKKSYKRDLLFIGFFELEKSEIETENLRHWRDYFTGGEVAGNAPGYIKKASRIIETANLSKEECRVATLLEKAQADYDAGIAGAYYDGKDVGLAEGMAKGLADGEVKGRKEMAKSMLEDGEPLEKIARYTKLPLEVIKSMHN